VTNNTRIYNRFAGYTTDDCACEVCLFYGGKKRPCLLDECCCMVERQAALEREQGANNGSTAHGAAALCRA